MEVSSIEIAYGKLSSVKMIAYRKRNHVNKWLLLFLWGRILESGV